MIQQQQFSDLDPNFPHRQRALTQAEFARLLKADPGNICRAFEAASIDPTDDWRNQLAALWAYRAEQAAGRRGDGTLDLVQERARQSKSIADRNEFELRRLRGEIIPLPIIVDTWARQNVECKTRMLSIPSKIHFRFPSIDRKIQTVLDEEIREALTTIASMQLPVDIKAQLQKWLENGEDPTYDQKNKARMRAAIGSADKRIDVETDQKNDTNSVPKVSRRSRKKTSKKTRRDKKKSGQLDRAAKQSIQAVQAAAAPKKEGDEVIP